MLSKHKKGRKTSGTSRILRLKEKITASNRAGRQAQIARTMLGRFPKQIGPPRNRNRDAVLSPPVIGSQARATNFMRSRFTQAPVHDDFPEGGLRIVGMLPPTDDDSLGTMASGDTTGTGAFKPATSHSTTSFGNYIGVSPTASSNSGYTSGGFIHGSSTNVIATLAQYFRFFRYRRLWAHYEGEAPTTTIGTVQFSYDRDVNSVYQAISNAAGAPKQAAVATTIVDRFPWWSPKVQVKLVDDMKSSPADRLYVCTSAGYDVLLTKPNADFELLFQGGISATTDTAQQATATVLGRYRWEFILDLYGFCGYPADNSVTDEKKRSDPVRQSHNRGDSKRPLDQLDADLADTVVLEPVSNRLRIATAVEPDLLQRSAPPSTQGARVSSKK